MCYFVCSQCMIWPTADICQTFLQRDRRGIRSKCVFPTPNWKLVSFLRWLPQSEIFCQCNPKKSYFSAETAWSNPLSIETSLHIWTEGISQRHEEIGKQDAYSFTILGNKIPKSIATNFGKSQKFADAITYAKFSLDKRKGFRQADPQNLASFNGSLFIYTTWQNANELQCTVILSVITTKPF